MILYTKLNNREVISSGITWFLGSDKERERFCVYKYRRFHLFSGLWFCRQVSVMAFSL